MTNDIEEAEYEPITTAVSVVPDMAMSPEEAHERLARFTAYVRTQMIPGEDFGAIPGTGSKPTLLKPGAEKLCNLFGFTPEAEILPATIERWDSDPPLFVYHVRTILRDMRTGQVVASGLGAANSMESKWRYRKGQRLCPKCGRDTIIQGKQEYGGGWLCFAKKGGCGAKFQTSDPAILNQKVGRVLNEDIADQQNTILKIAEKRSLVNATLKATRASGLFTQDMEEAGPPPEKGESELFSMTSGAVMSEALAEVEAVKQPDPDDDPSPGLVGAAVNAGATPVSVADSTAMEALKQRLRSHKEKGLPVGSLLVAAGISVPQMATGQADIIGALNRMTREDIQKVNAYMDQANGHSTGDEPW